MKDNLKNKMITIVLGIIVICYAIFSVPKPAKNNLINMSKICFVFKIMADDSICMYNYNFNTNQKFNNSYDFCSFKGLYVDNFSKIEFLEDVYMLDVCAKTIDDLSFLKNWSSIEYLRIHTSYITAGQKLYLNSLLPKCEIIYDE